MVHVVVDHPAGAWAARVVRRAAPRMLRRMREKRDLSVLLAGDARIRELNRRFRGKDRPTDVLSFPAEEPGYLGDVAISVDTARRVAAREGRPMSEEVSRYLAHGILHLLGFDHERSVAAARAMAAREDWLLGRPGLTRTGLAGKPAIERRKMRSTGKKR